MPLYLRPKTRRLALLILTMLGLTVGANFGADAPTTANRIFEEEAKTMNDPTQKTDGKILMLIGSVDDGDKIGGVTVYAYDTATAATAELSHTEISNASFLTVLNTQPPEVYVVTEGKYIGGSGADANDKKDARAYRFILEKNALTVRNSTPTLGDYPCHINVHPLLPASTRLVLVANYGGGNFMQWLIHFRDEASAASEAQATNFPADPPSHLHSSIVSPDGRYVFAADLGKDRIYGYKVNIAANDESADNAEKKKDLFLIPQADATQLPAGSGPRHFAFSKEGNYLYGLNELGGTVTAFRYHDGTLQLLQTIKSDVTAGEGKKSSADIHLTPDGNFLYTSNRITDNSIAIFRVNQTTGELTRLGQQATGKHPRNFAIAPDGKFLLVACRDDNRIQIFTIDPLDGHLTDTHREIKVQRPMCVQFMEDEI